MTRLERWLREITDRSKTRREVVQMMAKAQRIVLDKIYDDGLELLPDSDLLDQAISDTMKDKFSADLYWEIHEITTLVLPIEHFKLSVLLLMQSNFQSERVSLYNAATRLAISCNKIHGRDEKDDEGFAMVENMLRDAYAES